MFQTVSVKTPINFANFLKAAGAKLTLIGLEDLETANAVIKEFPTANSARYKEFKILCHQQLKSVFKGPVYFFFFIPQKLQR
jgi:hypothetical protein